MWNKIIENESAIEYFNQEAERLIPLLKAYKETLKEGRHLRSSEEEVKARFDEQDVHYSYVWQVDNTGNEISRYFSIAPDKMIGIDINDYINVRNLFGKLYKRKEIAGLISSKSLIELIFQWLKARYMKSTIEPEKFTEYLEVKISELVRNEKISIPIVNMAIDTEIVVGKVVFEFLKRDLFDKIEAKLNEAVNNGEMAEKECTHYIDKLRKDYQGKVVGTVQVIAERDRAIEKAEKEVDRSIMALKYFSKQATSPMSAALFGRKGMTWLPSRELFVFEDDIPDTIEETFATINNCLYIDNALFNLMTSAGLDKLSKILLKNAVTEFEELIITALYTFTKAISQVNYHDKIVFILSALEIVFLKDSGEQIQMSSGQRLGFCIHRDPQKRREVVELVSEAYKIRSNYIHHGQENEDIEIIRRLQIACWKALNIMINNHEKFSVKREFIDYVEGLIYS